MTANPSRPAPKPGAGTDVLVRVQGVSKFFGDVTAVDGVSLDIRRGEFFSLLGGSGCGKTTLLRMLAGFEIPSEGSILIDGVDVARVPPYERPVNMMFQSYALFPHMTVEGNVSFGLEQEGVAKPERRRRVAEALELVQLGAYGKRRPHQLSGGQRQRVALARALVKRPKLLLLDEPLAALDRKLRERTQFELASIQEEVGITFVMVTHDQEEAMTMSTRLAVMHAGRIVQVGTPTEIYEFPANRLVGEFIGTINVFEGHLASVGAGASDIEVAGLGAIRLDHAIEGGVGAPLAVGIRPEKMRIARADAAEPVDGPAVNRLEGTIEDIAYLGDLSIFHVRLADGRRISVSRTNITRRRDDPLTWEDPVVVQWDAAVPVVLHA
ncbi:MAG: ABC transporter ATP-binding protein [Pseudomonadota bacterium]|nr:ABC transporter ATP-binding protein [Pseudomonadota bacterium]